MAKPKKQTREERLIKKRLAEKKRYERIKHNNELWKEKQEKNRKNYIRRKEQKKQLSINEMTPRHQRAQRQRWRKNFKSYYLRKKQEKLTATILAENTPPQSPSILSDVDFKSLQDNNIQDLPPIVNRQLESPAPGSSMMSCSMPQQQSDLANSPSNVSSPPCSPALLSSAIRRMRYKKDKEIHNLKQVIHNLKRQVDRFRKKLQRTQVIKKNILTSGRTIQSKRTNTKNLLLLDCTKRLKKDVELFYEDDENSRLCSGKKEFIVRKKVRKQKRYLCDSLLNLHQKFLQTSNYNISYSAFCKLRPFWVLQPDSRARDTCLCKLHTNMDLIVQGLYQRKIISVKTAQDVLSLLCCDVYNVDCLHRACLGCKNRGICYQEFDNSIEMLYWQWETKQDVIQGSGRKIRTTEKVKKKEEPKKCIEKFESTLNEYFKHCGNIVCQQKAFRTLKENLQENECIIHIDYSENYAVKCNEEIQSYHFGGSRKQLTLHTSVIYFLDNEYRHQVQSFCTVSECLRHDISAVWAHIVPILEFLGEIKTNIRTVHFISDSPSSQYRNKKIFHLISCLSIYLDTIQTITWNYSESGHGKGAPDGVGAVMKRTADRAVSQGQDIKDLDDFLQIMDQNLKTVKLKTVSEYDVSEKDFLFPQNVKGFPGCMKMHQLVWNYNSSVIAVRKLSCTEKDCLYQTINCNHRKHLGFYQLEDKNQTNLYVTPLADSTRILREIDANFWNFSNETEVTNAIPNKHVEEDNSTTSKEKCIRQKQKSKLIPPKRKKEMRNRTRNKDNRQNTPTEEHTSIQRKMICSASNTGTDNSLKGNNEERALKSNEVAVNMDPATIAEFDSLSDITFSRDGNKELSIDLKNVNPYLIDVDDDDDFNIF